MLPVDVDIGEFIAIPLPSVINILEDPVLRDVFTATESIPFIDIPDDNE